MDVESCVCRIDHNFFVFFVIGNDGRAGVATAVPSGKRAKLDNFPGDAVVDTRSIRLMLSNPTLASTCVKG